MIKITAAEVNKLRKATGAGMMDCKKALQEAGGNFDKAIENLRKKGQKIANKRADKDATEGVVLAKTLNNKNAAIMVLNCETDFVAKNEDFVNQTKAILDVALNTNSKNIDELKKQKIENLTVENKIIDLTGKVGEKLEISKYANINAEFVASYIHPGNRLATVVAFNKKTEAEVGKNIAMQIAAMNPIAIDKDGISQEIIDKEIEIGKEIAIKEGKPEELAKKIAMGKLNKFYKEQTLVNQQFVKNTKITIVKYLNSVDKELKIVDFKRFTLRD